MRWSFWSNTFRSTSGAAKIIWPIRIELDCCASVACFGGALCPFSSFWVSKMGRSALHGPQQRLRSALCASTSISSMLASRISMRMKDWK